MAVTAYVGEPGSGKTYEVVSEVILPALRGGRRVVSNIRGLHYEEMRAYLLTEEGVAPESIGTLQLVDVEQPGKEGFFCTDASIAAGVQTVVHPGDVIVLDECWRWFRPGSDINKQMFEFFRMHRQFVDAKGTSCDVVLITQSMQDLDRKVKVVVEKHFRMEKYKVFGSKKSYSVQGFNGYLTSRNEPIFTASRRYKPKFFPFYSSYAGKGGDEQEVDGRLNVLRGALIKLGLPVALFAFAVGGFLMWKTWGKVAKKPEQAQGEVKPEAAKSGDVASPVAARPVEVSEWRSVGMIETARRKVFVVEKGGRYRFVEEAPEYRIGVLDVKVGIDGKPATGFSGGAPMGLGAALSR